MSIKFAVLGIIAERPLHGYAIRTEFETRFADIRELGYGQVYQVLAGLARSGYIVGHRETRAVTRITYSVSPSGRAALRGWLAGANLQPRGFHDDIFFRMQFVQQESALHLLTLIAGQLEVAAEDLSLLIGQRDGASADTGMEGLARRLYLEAEIMHREADMRALEVARVALEKLIGDADG